MTCALVTGLGAVVSPFPLTLPTHSHAAQRGRGGLA
jgi:hypothetical protein